MAACTMGDFPGSTSVDEEDDDRLELFDDEADASSSSDPRTM